MSTDQRLQLLVDKVGALVTIDSIGAKLPTLTVGTLPAAASHTGYRANVSDANATTFNSIVAAGGTNYVPVFCDGTNWRIG